MDASFGSASKNYNVCCFSIFIIGYSDPTILTLLVVCMLIIIKSAKVPFDRFTPILKAISPILILYAVFNLIGYHAPWTPTLLCYLFGHPIYVETIVYIVGMQLRFIGFALLIRLILLVTPIKRFYFRFNSMETST